MDGTQRINQNVISRLAPKSNGLVFEIHEDIEVKEIFVKDENNEPVDFEWMSFGEHLHQIIHLPNGQDLTLQVMDQNHRIYSPRLFRCGPIPGVVINYIHPKDDTYMPSGKCPCSPSIVEMDGRLLVSHDVFFHECAQNLTMVFYSDDQGDSWHFLSSIQPCFWGKLFVHGNKLYMMGNRHEYGDLLIYQSTDGGESWNKPSVIIKGGDNQKGGPHKGPMPIISHDHRLWTAIDHGSWSQGGHASGVVSINEEDDISKGENWNVSEFLPYNSQWEGTVKGATNGLLEGNVVVKPDGQLINLLRYQTNQAKPAHGKAIYLNVERERLTFGKVIDFPGNLSKFSVYFHKQTQKYFSIVSLADEQKPMRRNELVLISSKDCDAWKMEKSLLFCQDEKTEAFQYVDFLFWGKWIYYVSRTALNGAINYHDSNQITFHKTLIPGN